MKYIALALALVAAGCASTRTYSGPPDLARDRPFGSHPRSVDEWMLEDAPTPLNEKRAEELRYIAGNIAAVRVPKSAVDAAGM